MTDMRLGRERGLVYVDESGQLRLPRPGEPNEPGLLAAIFMRDTPTNLEALTQTGRLLAQSPKNAIPDEGLRAVAALIRERGYAAFTGIELGQDDGDRFDGMRRALRALFRQKRQDLGLKGLDLRLDILERQYGDESRRHRVYIPMLVVLFQRIAKWFRSHDILPSLAVILDEKLPRTAKELSDFLLRFAVSTEFPEVYGQRLGAVLGADPLPELTCRVGTDDRDEGLRIAHVVAYAKGKCIRGQDPDGRFARFFSQMYRPDDLEEPA